MYIINLSMKDIIAIQFNWNLSLMILLSDESNFVFSIVIYERNPQRLISPLTSWTLVIIPTKSTWFELLSSSKCVAKSWLQSSLIRKRNVTQCNATLCYATLCNVTLRYVMLYYVILCMYVWHMQLKRNEWKSIK